MKLASICCRARSAILGTAFIGVFLCTPENSLVHGQGISAQQLRQRAPELLHLRLDKITVTQEDSDRIDYIIEATVDKVSRSAEGFIKGDRMSFESYHIKPDAWRRGFVGPKSPPKLHAGWTGWVYLDESPSGQGLRPAAYGDSFQFSYNRKPMPAKPGAKIKGKTIGNSDSTKPLVDGEPVASNEDDVENDIGKKLYALGIETTNLLIEKGYSDMALLETEALAEHASRRLELLMKQDAEGSRRHDEVAFNKAQQRNKEAKRLPKK